MMQANFSSAGRNLTRRFTITNFPGTYNVRPAASTSIFSSSDENDESRTASFSSLSHLNSSNGKIVLNSANTKFNRATKTITTTPTIASKVILSGSSTVLFRREMSTTNTAAVSCSSPITPESEIEKFEQTAAAASTAVDSNNPLWTKTWYYPQDHMVDLINYLHDLSGLNYALTIAGLTVVMRGTMFPLFVKAQQNTSRMAHMKPEMDVLKAKIDKIDPNDQEMQVKMGMQMKALFKKYDCNPIKALAVPFVQAPVFMSMFFALRKMPEYFPDELSTGGILWFTDLTAPDPLYVMPVASALSFLAMMELGKEQMMASNPQQGKMMMTFFRGLAVFMVPVTLNFSTAIFCYWTTNNTISLVQSALFRQKGIRAALGIWEPPKPVPGAPPPKGFMESMQEAMDNARNRGGKLAEMSQEDKIKAHNEAIDNKKKMEILQKNKTVAARKRRRSAARRK